MTSVRVGDITLNYELDGPAAAPVICLNHCFGADLHYWDPHLSAFDGFRILRHDARGHGKSDVPPGPYSLDMMAADLLGLLDALDIPEVHLCGVSMGGMIAQTTALDYPERIASLALVNTTSEYDEAQLKGWRDRAELVAREGVKAVHAALMSRWFTDDAAQSRPPGYRYMAETFAGFEPVAFCAVSDAVLDLNTTARLPEIKAPVTVIATPDDPGVPTEISLRMAHKLGIEPNWLEPARHLATLEQPEAFNRLIRDFLTGPAVANA